MKITEQKLRWFSEIGEQIIDFADTYAMAKYNQSGGMYISCFNPHSISFRMEWETGCMGCYDKHDMDFDISFDMLASPNWKEKLQAEIDEARRKAKEKDEADRRRYAKQQQDYEQAEYLRLKQKYER
jgi:hypothetical protein